MITEQEIESLGFHRIAVYRDGGTLDFQYKDTNLILKYRGNNIMRRSNEMDLKYIVDNSTTILISSKPITTIEQLKSSLFDAMAILKLFHSIAIDE